MPVPVLKQGDLLIASIVAALSDRDLEELRDDLAQKIGKFRAKGVIVDVTALDVLDSFATRTLRGIVYTARLRGAQTVIVGIQPEVAMAMVQLGLTLDEIHTALVEAGIALLERVKQALEPWERAVERGGQMDRDQRETDVVARASGRRSRRPDRVLVTEQTLMDRDLEVARNIVEPRAARRICSARSTGAASRIRSSPRIAAIANIELA
jgi:rsbT antagonist protein RsbS